MMLKGIILFGFSVAIAVAVPNLLRGLSTGQQNLDGYGIFNSVYPKYLPQNLPIEQLPENVNAQDTYQLLESVPSKHLGRTKKLLSSQRIGKQIPVNGVEDLDNSNLDNIKGIQTVQVVKNITIGDQVYQTIEYVPVEDYLNSQQNTLEHIKPLTPDVRGAPLNNTVGYIQEVYKKNSNAPFDGVTSVMEETAPQATKVVDSDHKIIDKTNSSGEIYRILENQVDEKNFQKKIEGVRQDPYEILENLQNKTNESFPFSVELQRIQTLPIQSGDQLISNLE